MTLLLAPRVGITKDEHEHIRAHYSRALPWLERHFGGTPLLFVSFPLGWDGDRVFHKVLKDLPATIRRVEARTSAGVHKFVRLDAHNVTWVCAKYYAVELDGWSPTLDDPQRAAFARVVLSPHGSTSEDAVFSGALLLAGRLEAEGLQAIPVLDGFRGLTLWIPFSDGPDYNRLSSWVHGFAAKSAADEPALFTVENLRAERGNWIYLGTKSITLEWARSSRTPYAERWRSRYHFRCPSTISERSGTAK